MAVTDIQATVLRITGVTPTANSVEDAQRFVVSSVPKNLLKWAATFTVPSNHGGNTSDGVTITMPTGTDSVLDVSRNGFSATEVPYEMKGFIANTASLHLATNTYPKYYLNDTNPGEGSKVIVKPIPTDSATAVVLYVDYSKIDDDCDLRNAVIYHTSSHEFSKLGSDELPTISIDAVPPDSPTISVVAFNTSNTEDLDASLPTTYPFTVATVSAATELGTTSNFKTYFESTDTFNPLNDNDPGEFSLLTVPPDAPTVPDFNINIDTDLPTYTSLGDLTTMSDSDTSSQTAFDQWFDVVGDYIADEDVELSTAQIQKISTYIQAYSGEMQNNLNDFNTQLQAYQAELSNELQEAQYEQQAEHASKIQQYQAEVAHYQAEVNTEVNEYTQKLQRYNTELGIVHQSWTTMYQAAIQESIQELQVENQRNMAAAQAELQLNIDNENRSQQRQLQNAINDMQALLQDNQSKISKYQAETAVYQAESSNNIQEYQSKVQKQQAYSKEADKYYQWANAEVQIYIQNNSKMISSTMAAQASAQQRGR